MTNVERVLQAMPGPLALANLLGLKVQRGSRPDRLRVCCPWHNEKNPSCDVTFKQGRVVAKCRSCDAGGDGISLAAAVWGMSERTDFYEVLRRLADMLGVRLEEAPTPREPKDPVRELMTAIDWLADEFNRHGELRPSCASARALVEQADPEQREEACRRLDALYDAEREALVKAGMVSDMDRERDDALDEMAPDVLRAIARREAAALKRMRLVPEIAAIEADAAMWSATNNDPEAA